MGKEEAVVKEENIAEEMVPVNEEKDSLTEYDHKRIDHDIKYRGPLSYRHLKIAGWIFLAVTFVATFLASTITYTEIFYGTESAVALQKVVGALSYFSALPLPLFLIANFAIILQHRNNFKKILTLYAKLVLFVYIGFIFIYYHYIVILLMSLGNCSFGEARDLSVKLFTALGKQGGLVVNVFVDLFMCALIMFFIEYTPKKNFRGKNIIWFRLMVFLPILFEVGSAVLMGLINMNGKIDGFSFGLVPEVLPLIGKKPIGMIIAFVLICLFVKIREKIYIKRGGTKEGYELYLNTNRNSFKLSLVMAIIFFVIAIIDFLAVLIPAACLPNPSTENIVYAVDILSGFTLGKSICLILVIPFVLLFSYSKQHKNPKFDKLLPIIGIGLVVFTVIETIFFSIVL